MADSQSVNSEVRSSNEASEREERLRKCRQADKRRRDAETPEKKGLG